MGWFKHVMGVGSSEPEPPKLTEENIVVCCGESSIMTTWEGGKYVYKCINCGAVVG